MRGTGADQPVVALKPGNAGGAKGLTGFSGRDESTSNGRNSCQKQGRAWGGLQKGWVNPQGEESVPDVAPRATSKQIRLESD